MDLNKIREQGSQDVILKDGDIVIVEYGAVKNVLSGFLRGISSFVGFGYTIN